MDRFTSERRARLVANVDALDSAAERDCQALQTSLESQLPAMVQRWVSRFWPSSRNDRN
jgi:hypothetical protein